MLSLSMEISDTSATSIQPFLEVGETGKKKQALLRPLTHNKIEKSIIAREKRALSTPTKHHLAGHVGASINASLRELTIHRISDCTNE